MNASIACTDDDFAMVLDDCVDGLPLQPLDDWTGEENEFDRGADEIAKSEQQRFANFRANLTAEELDEEEIVTSAETVARCEVIIPNVTIYRCNL